MAKSRSKSRKSSASKAKNEAASDRSEGQGSFQPEDQKPHVSVGKVPGGQVVDVRVEGVQTTVKEVFALAGIKGVDKCDILVNGEAAHLDDKVKAGDEVLAAARIRGN